jgi:hypothetical protein
MYLNIKLDLSFLPTEIRASIIKNIQKELSSPESKSSSTILGWLENKEVGSTNGSDSLYTVWWASGSLHEFKSFLENILLNNYEEYMVAEDTSKINTLTILKQGDVEQFGMYMCTHCGTFFKSIEERTLHERIHYFM